MFQLEMFPACEGDCLILTWGQAGEERRMLIDAGRQRTAQAVLDYVRREKLGTGAFELFVVSHIDRDHIEGAVNLLHAPTFRPLVKEIWFNGRTDLTYEPARGFETFGALDGERITKLIADNRIPLNLPFKPGPVAVGDDGLPVVELEGGLTLTLLSPDLKQLAALAETWDETVANATPGWEQFGEPEAPDMRFLAAQKFKADRAKPNGTSIAFVASYNGRDILLAADAHVPRLTASLAKFIANRPEHAGFSLVKASHHGSKANISMELVSLLNCHRWAISTNGDQFRHPDREAIARIISASPGPVELCFNYDTEYTNVWRKPPKGFPDVESRYGDRGYLKICIE